MTCACRTIHGSLENSERKKYLSFFLPSFPDERLSLNFSLHKVNITKITTNVAAPRLPTRIHKPVKY